MRIRYSIAIHESLDELAAHEHRLRGRKAAVRVRLLRLLKSGQAHNLAEAAALVGYSKTQAVRWWERYRADGLEALEREPHYAGQPARLTAEARADLDAAMRRGEIATLEEARRYLASQWGIEYQSVNGIWWHFRHHRTRKKTGRRRHQLASSRQQEEFKKTLPAR
jgi:transposase